MSRVLILGGDGLLGSHLYLAMKNICEVRLTLHSETPGYPDRLFAAAHMVPGVAANDRAKLATVFDDFRPDWAINAIGLTKRPLSREPFASLEANTLFPHLLAGLCAEYSARMIHFSTDGIFSGRAGHYSETDSPDCMDWYGRCKFLGEPCGSHVLSLRTAFIGLELACKKSLVEWFLSQRGSVPGYRKAIWSGLTAIEIGRLVGRLVQRTEPLSGLWHVATPAISKFELLTSLNNRLGDRGVVVVPDDSFVCNRSLDGSAFAQQSGYVPPSWDEMLDELAEDIRQRWVPDAPSYWPH